MARENVTRAIDGVDYKVVQLGAKEGNKLFIRLFRILAPTLGTLLENAPPGGNLGDIPVDALGPALSALADKVTEEEFDNLVRKFAPCTMFGKESADRWQPLSDHFDDHFAGRQMACLMWLRFCLEVNFSDFFVAFKQAAERQRALKTKTVAASNSPAI